MAVTTLPNKPHYDLTVDDISEPIEPGQSVIFRAKRNPDANDIVKNNRYARFLDSPEIKHMQ